MPPRASSSWPRNISHCVDGSVTTRYSSLSYGAGFPTSAQPRHPVSRVNTIRWLRHHSTRRYGPDPTGCWPNFAPYVSSASCGTMPVKDIAMSHGNTWNGFVNVIATVRSSVAFMSAT